jgi:hypothetical protein
MAEMNDSEEKRQLTEAEIDRIVISHAEDDSAWEEAVLVKRSRRAVIDPVETPNEADVETACGS